MNSKAVRLFVVAVALLGVAEVFTGDGHQYVIHGSYAVGMTTWALVPFAAVIVGELFVARSIVDQVILLVIAAFLAITASPKPDELGLVYFVGPLMYTGLVGLALAFIAVRRAWPKWRSALKQRKGHP